jgi:ABC-type Fe3+-hydroxamate transport system substrate-binding protein
MRAKLLLLSLIFTVSVLALTACGSSSDEGSSAKSSATATKADEGAFPVTINHKYGSTTIKSEPKRVVVAGLREQDALLALGVIPVATTEWYGKHPGAIFPWAKTKLGNAKVPTVLSSTDGLQIEKIAAQRPDLILAVYSGMTKKEYTALSKIAPVVGQPKGEVDYGSSWQEETTITGKAVGRNAKAAELVAQTEKLVADAAAAHPEFEGKTAANVSDYQGIFVYGPQDVRTRMLEDLGFSYPQALRKAFPKDFGGQLSDEKVDAIDVDALIWFADGDRSVAKLKENGVYGKLAVRKQGRDVFVLPDDRVYEATSFPSVLSMPTLLQEMVPRLVAAVDGNPNTPTDQQIAKTPAAAAIAAQEGTFPAKATHRFGTTTVPKRPERIVIVGLTEQDTVLALGSKPIATTEWYGDHPGAIWPWARSAMGATNPKVLEATDGIPIEKVAALRPDLIIGTNSGMKKKDYDKLSRFAPTIAGVKGGTDYFSPWDQQTLLIAQALGKEEAGRKLVADIKASYAKVGAEHPEFAGKSATFSQGGFYNGLIYVYPPGLNTEFLSYLGFDINPKLKPLIKKPGEQVEVSTERLDVLDADVAVFATEEPKAVKELLKVPTFAKLPVVTKKRSVYTNGTLAGAIYFMTPLSLPYVLEHLTPQLETAVAGKAPQRVLPAAS